VLQLMIPQELSAVFSRSKSTDFDISWKIFCSNAYEFPCWEDHVTLPQTPNSHSEASLFAPKGGGEGIAVIWCSEKRFYYDCRNI